MRILAALGGLRPGWTTPATFLPREKTLWLNSSSFSSHRPSPLHTLNWKRGHLDKRC